MKRSDISAVSATLIGFGALLIWSMAGVLTAQVRNIPTFEILTISYTISFSITLVYLYVTKSWHKIKQPWHIWIIGMLGIAGGDGFYITAYKYAPPAHVDTIYYLWPIILLLISRLFLKDKFTLRQSIAAVISMIGIIWLINGEDLTFTQVTHYRGYVFAFCEALVCALYTISVRYFKNVPHEMIGIYCGCAMFASLINHSVFESFVMPNSSQWITMVLMVSDPRTPYFNSIF